MVTTDGFMLVGITRPDFYEGEARAIVRAMTELGVSYVHVRKPGADETAVEQLISQIPQELRLRLTVHYHFPLAFRCGLGGVHLSASCPEPPAGWSGRVSRSCHNILWPDGSPYGAAGSKTDGTSWAVGDGMPTDYDFLSPIFDSISKEGYRSAFSYEMLREAARLNLIGARTVALGGVSWGRLEELKEIGFGGAAMLGALWKK